MDIFEFLESRGEVMQDKLDQLLESPAFQEEVAAFRQEHNIDPDEMSAEISAELQLHLSDFVDYLRIRFDLDTRWENCLRRHILYDVTDPPMVGPLTHVHRDPVTEKYTAHIAVFADTREEEVIQGYREIAEFFRENMPMAGDTKKRTDIYADMETHRQWYEMRLEGLTFRKIAERWNEQEGQSINHTTVMRGIAKYKSQIIDRGR